MTEPTVTVQLSRAYVKTLLLAYFPDQRNSVMGPLMEKLAKEYIAQEPK